VRSRGGADRDVRRRGRHLLRWREFEGGNTASATSTPIPSGMVSPPNSEAQVASLADAAAAGSPPAARGEAVGAAAVILRKFSGGDMGGGGDVDAGVVTPTARDDAAPLATPPPTGVATGARAAESAAAMTVPEAAPAVNAAGMPSSTPYPQPPLVAPTPVAASAASGSAQRPRHTRMAPLSGSRPAVRQLRFRLAVLFFVFFSHAESKAPYHKVRWVKEGSSAAGSAAAAPATTTAAGGGRCAPAFNDGRRPPSRR